LKGNILGIRDLWTSYISIMVQAIIFTVLNEIFSNLIISNSER